jgi:hypothetical protein
MSRHKKRSCRSGWCSRKLWSCADTYDLACERYSQCIHFAPRNLRRHVTAAPSATRDFTRPATLATACYCGSELDFTRPATPAALLTSPPLFSFSLSLAPHFSFFAPHISLFSLFTSSSHEHLQRTRPWRRIQLRSPAFRGCSQVPVENSCHSKMIRVMATYPAQTCGSLGVDCLGVSGFRPKGFENIPWLH